MSSIIEYFHKLRVTHGTNNRLDVETFCAKEKQIELTHIASIKLPRSSYNTTYMTITMLLKPEGLIVRGAEGLRKNIKPCRKYFSQCPSPLCQ